MKKIGLLPCFAGIIANGKNSDHYIAVNGCPVKCATKALQSAEINVDEELVITEDFALQKNKNFHDETKLTEIEQRLKDLVEQYR
ncbi:MAG: hypothetical protein PWR10_940 [Halanaerobiales bacterium]|nr:hypothetical protein [Halanaerobiales bacterium]